MEAKTAYATFTEAYCCDCPAIQTPCGNASLVTPPSLQSPPWPGPPAGGTGPVHHPLQQGQEGAVLNLSVSPDPISRGQSGMLGRAGVPQDASSTPPPPPYGWPWHRWAQLQLGMHTCVHNVSYLLCGACDISTSPNQLMLRVDMQVWLPSVHFCKSARPGHYSNRLETT
jgi:hypothetical protein